MPQSLSMYSRVTSTGNGLGLWTRNCTRSPSNNLTPGAGQAIGWPCLSVLSLSRRISSVTFTPASIDSSAWLRARSAEGSVASFFRFWTRAMRPRRSSRVALSFRHRHTGRRAAATAGQRPAPPDRTRAPGRPCRPARTATSRPCRPRQRRPGSTLPCPPAWSTPRCAHCGRPRGRDRPGCRADRAATLTFMSP